MLVLAAALVVSQLGSRWPHDLRFGLRLGRPSTVSAVRLTWLSRDEPVQGSRLTFSQGAPETIETAVRLREGTYDVEIEVERSGPLDDAGRPPEPTTTRRPVSIGDATSVTISLP